MGFEVLVGNGDDNDGEGGVDKVEDDEVDAVDDTRARVGAEELKPKEKKSVSLHGLGEYDRIG